MPRVSRSFRNQKISKDIEPLLWFALSRGKNPKVARDIFGNLFTTEEKIMLSKRIAALYLIHKGLHYKEVADSLAISIETVNKIKYKYLSHRKFFLPLLKGLEKIEAQMVSKSGKENFFVSLLHTRPSNRMRNPLYQALGL